MVSKTSKSSRVSVMGAKRPIVSRRPSRPTRDGALAVVEGALPILYQVASMTHHDLLDTTQEDSAHERDVWVLTLSSVPMLNRAMRAACPLDVSIAATLAYERMRMLGDGGRKALPRVLKGNPLWHMWGVPPILDLSTTLCASPPPFVISLRRETTTESLYGFGDTHVATATTSDVRKRRIVAVRAIERGKRAEGCERRGWHRCADLPLVHAKVSTFVVWMRSLAVAIKALPNAPGLCVPSRCRSPRCNHIFPSRRHTDDVFMAEQRKRIEGIADVASRVDGKCCAYWECALDSIETPTGATLAASSSAHTRFCSPGCREVWIEEVWSRLPCSANDLEGQDPRRSRDQPPRPDSTTRIDGELALAMSRNQAVSARMGGNDAWRTDAWWRREGVLAPPPELVPVCIYVTAAIVQALNVDLALLVCASTISNTRLPFGTRQRLPGGAVEWRSFGSFWRPMLLTLIAAHEGVPEPVPIGRHFHLEKSTFAKHTRSIALALFDQRFGAVPVPPEADDVGAGVAVCSQFGGCGCVPRSGHPLTPAFATR